MITEHEQREREKRRCKNDWSVLFANSMYTQPNQSVLRVNAKQDRKWTNFQISIVNEIFKNLD